jgi:hypothetical protein
MQVIRTSLLKTDDFTLLTGCWTTFCNPPRRRLESPNGSASIPSATPVNLNFRPLLTLMTAKKAVFIPWSIQENSLSFRPR